ncbi:MAG: DUF1499 domain-containing protein [Nitratireductor sp.]
MTGYYERRWSAAARWCQRLALVSIPYLLLTILLHRFGKVTTPQLYWLLFFGLLMLLASLAMGVRALLDLWNLGYRGGKATIRGVMLSLLMLLPFLWQGWLAVENPRLADVSTNPYDPPQFVEAARLREAGRKDGMNMFASYDAEYAEKLLSEYPKVGSRRYNAGAERILAAVRELVASRGWKIMAERGIPMPSTASDPVEEQDQNGAAALPKVTSGRPTKAEKSAASDEVTESGAPLDFEIEAEAATLVFGFRHDIVIKIVSEEEATLVDMRAASRFGAHDFGSNAAIIRNFLSDLDTALLGIAGEG